MTKTPGGHRAEVVIVGGSLGGVAAALAAAGLGATVILASEHVWLGGQLTTQAVPPDEHPWIDKPGIGGTATYRRLRRLIRRRYIADFPLVNGATEADLNPGRGNVSPLCHEPHVSARVIGDMLAPFVSSGLLTLLTTCRPTAVHMNGDRVAQVDVRDSHGRSISLEGSLFLDATELGDLLALGNVEHVVGAESVAQTGELHALPEGPDPLDQQAHSWCFAMSHDPTANLVIDRPAAYDRWRSYAAEFWPGPLLSWTTSDPITLEPVTRGLFDPASTDEYGSDLWHFRRIRHNASFGGPSVGSDIVLVNWPQIDYWLGPIAGVEPDTAQEHYAGSKELSECFFYWMQTEAPRPDGGTGYPGLWLRPGVLGTNDGFAMEPYIRESRRIAAEFTVCEQHVGVEARPGADSAEQFKDSVGIGSYRIDLHPSYRRNYLDIINWPHQIPLGSLLPVRVENLLPASKNLGVTHITNGCYRLHPVEWNIGESAGALAAYCVKRQLAPRQVRHTPNLLEDFQRLLTDELGVELAWPDEQRLTPRHKIEDLGF